MDITENDVQRMELQIGELIRILANINQRLQRIESSKDANIIVQQIPIVQNIK